MMDSFNLDPSFKALIDLCNTKRVSESYFFYVNIVFSLFSNCLVIEYKNLSGV